MLGSHWVHVLCQRFLIIGIHRHRPKKSRQKEGKCQKKYLDASVNTRAVTRYSDGRASSGCSWPNSFLCCSQQRKIQLGRFFERIGEGRSATRWSSASTRKKELPGCDKLWRGLFKTPTIRCYRTRSMYVKYSSAIMWSLVFYSRSERNRSECERRAWSHIFIESTHGTFRWKGRIFTFGLRPL